MNRARGLNYLYQAIGNCNLDITIYLLRKSCFIVLYQIISRIDHFNSGNPVIKTWAFGTYLF